MQLAKNFNQLKQIVNSFFRCYLSTTLGEIPLKISIYSRNDKSQPVHSKVVHFDNY